VRGLVGVSLAGRRVMFSGRWDQGRVRNEFMIMRVPVSWTAVAENSDVPLDVGSR
jgi:hypothetical protein